MAGKYDKRGLRFGKDGEYHYPFVEVAGVWVERDDVEWEDDPDTFVPDKTPDDIRSEHAQLAVTVKLKKNDQFTAHGVTVKLIDRLKVKGDLLEVHVLAVDANSGALLNVDDGLFQFYNPPCRTEAEFKDYLAFAVARYNGMV